MPELGSAPEAKTLRDPGPASTPRERRYRAALDNVVDAIIFVDHDLNIIEGNAAAEAIAGPTVAGGSGVDLIHPADRDLVAETFADLVSRPGRRRDVKLRVLTGDEWLWVMATAVNRLDDPDVASVVISFRDLTPEISLQRSEAMFRSLVNSVPIGIVAGSERWRADYLNDRFAELISRPLDATRAQGWVDALDPVAARALAEVTLPANGARMTSTILDWRSGPATVQLDVRLHADGSYVVAATDVSGLMSELEAERSSAAMWAHAATHDPLTGIANRALGLDRLAVAIAALPRLERNISVTFVDLDSFKEINDEFGHHVGDSVLREVARRLSAAVRAGDTVARWGGDEFVVIAQVDATERPPEALAQRLVKEVNAPIEVAPGGPIRLVCSMGMAVAGPDDARPGALLRAADMAMYEAKRSGSGVEMAVVGGPSA